MSESKIRRKYKSLPVTLATTVADATAIRFDDVAGGSLVLGTASTNATSIQVWASDAVGGTYGRLHSDGGDASSITLAASTSNSTVYSLPDACYSAGAIKLVPGEAEGTAGSASVLLKT